MKTGQQNTFLYCVVEAVKFLSETVSMVLFWDTWKLIMSQIVMSEAA